MAEAVLAIDQGTTGTTAMVLDGRGRILGRAYGEIRQFYPRPGWVEHDPEQLYRSVVRLARQAHHRAVELFRSEEHTSELQSHLNLVCRLPLEKKKLHILLMTTL